MSKVVLIIQARMGSKRLPGKSMLDLAGKPLVSRIIERVKRCKKIDEIVLAIPNTKENKILLEIAKVNEISFYEGSENNLLERYFKAAVMNSANYVVRLPADNAVPEPNEIDKIIAHHLSLNRRGFSSNLSSFFNSGYPDGIGAEIFDFSLLSEVYHKEKNLELQEHIHLNFFDYSNEKPKDPKWCPISTLNCPSEYRRPELVLDINTYSQYKFIKDLYNYLYKKKPEFTIEDIIDWYDNVYKKN